MSLSKVTYRNVEVSLRQIWDTPCGNFKYIVTGITQGVTVPSQYSITLQRVYSTGQSRKVDIASIPLYVLVRDWKLKGPFSTPELSKEESFTVSVDANGLIAEVERLINEMEEECEMVHPEYIRGRLEQMLNSEVRD